MTALFWHGHFAPNEDKIRDYRKLLKQLELFQREGLGNFRTLLIGVAQDPAMLAFLDAGVNVKGAPNENFAREIMELFTMGVGNTPSVTFAKVRAPLRGGIIQARNSGSTPPSTMTMKKNFSAARATSTVSTSSTSSSRRRSQPSSSRPSSIASSYAKTSRRHSKHV